MADINGINGRQGNKGPPHTQEKKEKKVFLTNLIHNTGVKWHQTDNIVCSPTILLFPLDSGNGNRHKIRPVKLAWGLISCKK